MAFIRSVRVRWDDVEERDRYPFVLPAVRHLGELDLDHPVTFFVGDNGSGKSTLLEAIAVHHGLNPEGGTQNMNFGSVDVTVSDLHDHLWVDRAGRASVKFFLRAESFFNVATAIQEYGVESAYGGVSLHDMSHGESFLQLVDHRFGPRGLYFLDEPEAALSIHGLFRLMVRMRDLVDQGSQFIVATHSPVLMAFPDARLYEFSDGAVETVDWDDVDTVTLTRSFLNDPDRFVERLLAD